MRSIYTVYYPEADLTLSALELKVVEDKAVVLVQDIICIAHFINEVWTIGDCGECLLDLCDVIQNL